MIDLIQDNLEAVADRCRQYGVRKLEVFSSAATGAFDPETSDIDFLCEFDDPEHDLVDRFLGLAENLEGLFGRRVDLIPNRRFDNPYFRSAVNRSRVMVYERASREAAT